MNAVRAIWTNGRIQASEPVDRPEGCELIVELLDPSDERRGLAEIEGPNDAAAIAAWVAGVATIEPLVLTDEERVELDRYRAEGRSFNIEAVRRQMGLEDES